MLKPLRAFAAAAVLAGAAVMPTNPANADPTTAPAQNGANAQLTAYCYSLLVSGDFSDALNFGRCMSFNSNSNEGFGSSFCEYLRGENLLADYGFSSYSDCINAVHP